MMSDVGQYDPGNSGLGLKGVLAGVAVAALVASNIYQYVQLDRVKTDLAQMRESVSTELTNLRETSTVTSATNRRHMDSLRDQVDSTRRQAAQAASQAKSEAMAETEQMGQKLTEEQKRTAQQLSSEVGQVREAATSANAKIADVSGDVSNVKSQVASAKSEIDKTIADLKKVTGDVSQQGSYIATNTKELSALRRLGERNFIEFNLGKTKDPQKVGDVSVLLKKADPKHNKFTIEVMADDKRTEKRDRNVNEPVQFYVAKGRMYEIVVNQVKKDQIVGYMATPKDQIVRN